MGPVPESPKLPIFTNPLFDNGPGPETCSMAQTLFTLPIQEDYASHRNQEDDPKLSSEVRGASSEEFTGRRKRSICEEKKGGNFGRCRKEEAEKSVLLKVACSFKACPEGIGSRSFHGGTIPRGQEGGW